MLFYKNIGTQWQTRQHEKYFCQKDAGLQNIGTQWQTRQYEKMLFCQKDAVLKIT